MTISDPQECELFRKFIKVYGEAMTVDFPENNLEFWLEVQKYKVGNLLDISKTK